MLPVTVTQVVDMLVSEFANLIIRFNILISDQKIITNFTHLEFQFFALSLWVIQRHAGRWCWSRPSRRHLHSELTGVFAKGLFISNRQQRKEGTLT